MSIEDVKRLYEAIGEDQQLQAELEELESRDEVIDKILEIANRRELDVSRSDVETFVEKLTEDEAKSLDDEQLDDVAGGSGDESWDCDKRTGCRLMTK